MIAVLSDIHSNLPSLKAVLADMPKEVSEVWILGDIIGAGPSYPCEVLDVINNLPFPVVSVLGNQEIAILEAKNGRHPEWWLGTQMRLMAWITDQLMPQHWEYLNTLSHTAIVNHIPQGALLFHGKPDNVRGQVFSKEDARNVIQGIEQHILTCGHTHKARLFRIENYTIINSGAVGVSIDGMSGIACYVLLSEYDDLIKHPKVIFRHVSYDVEEVVKSMVTRGLTEMAPGISRAVILELRTGRAYLGSLISFCNRYAEQQLERKVDTVPADLWREAELLWDSSENLDYRML